MALALDTATDAAIRAHGAADYPHECCGALLGRRTGPGVSSGVSVIRAVRMRNMNTERARDRFTLDPKELMDVEKAADREGLELVGIYHSHPDSPAEPSVTDLSFAAPWPGLSWIILSVRGGRPAELRSWVVTETGKTFTEEPVMLPGDDTGMATGVAAGARP